MEESKKPVDKASNHGRPLPPVETRWKPGKSGNPRGRPKKSESLTDLLRDEMKKICPTDPEGRTYGELFVQGQVIQAMKGGVRAAKEIWKRHDGKLAEPKKKTWDDLTHEEQEERMRDARRRIRAIYGLDDDTPAETNLLPDSTGQ